jgi:hypothetical protein
MVMPGRRKGRETMPREKKVYQAEVGTPMAIPRVGNSKQATTTDQP